MTLIDADPFSWRSHLYAIAQAAPGPNVLVVTLIGWKVAGLAGAITATAAICLPMSVVVYLAYGHWENYRAARWRSAIQIDVAPFAVGLIFSGALLVGQSAGLGWAGWAFVLAVAAFSTKTRYHPLWCIAAGAVLGVADLV
ncbi:MAG: chromate transporter [Zoogloeaceae bacterium]|nr:chromate transporter [Zoogloeaceae bacterium]